MYFFEALRRLVVALWVLVNFTLVGLTVGLLIGGRFAWAVLCDGDAGRDTLLEDLKRRYRP